MAEKTATKHSPKTLPHIAALAVLSLLFLKAVQLLSVPSLAKRFIEFGSNKSVVYHGDKVGYSYLNRHHGWASFFFLPCATV